MKIPNLMVLLLLSISSAVLQFFHPIEYIIFHRFIFGFCIVFLLINIKIHVTELSDTKSRGRYLYFLLSCTSIGSSLSFLFNQILSEEIDYTKLRYELTQVPFIILPLLTIFAINSFSEKDTCNKRPFFKGFFSKENRKILILMALFAGLSVFASHNSLLIPISKMWFETNTFLNNILTYPVAILSIITGLILIDRINRIDLLKIGLICLLILSLVFFGLSFSDNAARLIVIPHLLYSFVSGICLYTLLYILVLEYLPKDYRGRGLIVYSLMLWGFEVIYNTLTKHLYDNEFFITVIAMVMLASIVIAWFLLKNRLVETRDKSLEDLTDELIG